MVADILEAEDLRGAVVIPVGAVRGAAAVAVIRVAAAAGVVANATAHGLASCSNALSGDFWHRVHPSSEVGG